MHMLFSMLHESRIPAKKGIIPVIASKPDQYSGNETLRVITDHVSI